MGENSPNAAPHVTDTPGHVTGAPDHVTGGPDHVTARYRLMSPAKLPISRSACITIPPGLSPTSFLDSPVLLTNIKAEPSPTTGSFFQMQGTTGSVVFPLNTQSSNAKLFGDSSSNHFEFKPHVGSTSASGLQVSAVFNLQQSEQRGESRDPNDSRSYVPSTLAKCQMAAPKEPNSLGPVYMLAPCGTEPVGSSYDESRSSLHPKSGVQMSQSGQKDSVSLVPADKSMDDGYNWRKYGQKLVKGSEFPRSYYKCTHPNCEVKKIFERSYTGQITDIVYKGTHDHPKPQPSRRFAAGALMCSQEEKSEKFTSLAGQADISTFDAPTPNSETDGTPVPSPRQANDESTDGATPLLNSTNDELDDDDLLSKRRRTEFGNVDITTVVKPIREPRVVVQTISEVDILDDGYRWRKYGQKVVRGNPNPRSYYKCTNAGCPVRKHVERASHDPKAVITTYEGKHNHDVPIAKTSSHDAAGPSAGNGMSMIRSPEENSRICLDLGVGSSFRSDHRSSGQPQTSDSFKAQSQLYAGLYGSRENGVESHSFDIAQINPSSNPYSHKFERVVLGP